MFLLKLYQEEIENTVALFNSLEEGREFAALLPGYKVKNEDGFTYESIEYSLLGDYMEIEYRGNRVPLSKHSFVPGQPIGLLWVEIPNLSLEGSGLMEGGTRVDAYIIENKEAEEYIRLREEKYRKIKNILEEKGLEVDRAYQGSEDGEAILYRKSPKEEWHFLTHMDPFFVEDLDPETIEEEI